VVLKTTLVWGHVERPWGYEVRVDFVDGDGRIYNECLTFAAEPDSSELDEAIESHRLMLESHLEAESNGG